MFSTITIDDLNKKHEKLSSDELILDVRTPEEFQEGHIPGARNIAHTEVSAHTAELRKYKRVYIYCRSGGRVQTACYELVNLGLNNLVGVVSGGMPNWVQSGFPTEK